MHSDMHVRMRMGFAQLYLVNFDECKKFIESRE